MASSLALDCLTTEHNIGYIDLTSGVLKMSHHAVFGELWYCQPIHSPGIQLQYRLYHGLSMTILPYDLHQLTLSFTNAHPLLTALQSTH
jgi:hypothetical protein